MLFEFSQDGKYQFWMKDMRFPLDFVWFKDDNVTEVMGNISYSSKDILSPGKPINSVLEINANYAQLCNIKIGDRIEK
jgi:uncharacterized membrane protein (UPF0127 family)